MAVHDASEDLVARASSRDIVSDVEHAGRHVCAQHPADISRFFEAVDNGNERTVCLMLKQGFDPDQLNTEGWSTGQSALGAAIDGEELGSRFCTKNMIPKVPVGPAYRIKILVAQCHTAARS